MKKRKAARTSKLLDEQYLGSEPVFTKDKKLTDLDLMAAYNWYNYFHDNKTAKKFTLARLKEKNIPRKAIQKLNTQSDFQFATIGWISRMLSRGASLPERTVDWYAKKLNELLQRKDAIIDDKPTVVVSIQERISDQLNELIGDMDKALDDRDYDFKTYEYLQNKNVKGMQAKKIAAYYKPIQAELNQVLTKPDDQLKEGYRHMKKPEIKKVLALLDSFVSDAQQIANNSKLHRKPRKKKAKSLEKIISKIKFKDMDDSLKLRSVDPKDIIGAQYLWVFNTKTRKLGRYDALDTDGLKIKGTTIQSFNETTSIQKKLRKPDKQLPVITQGGKVALRNAMDDIKAKSQLLTGRLNSDTILLKTGR